MPGGRSPLQVPSPSSVNLSDVRIQLPVEGIATYRHLKLVKGVFGDIVGIKIIYFAHGNIHVGLESVGKEQELGACQSVETL